MRASLYAVLSLLIPACAAAEPTKAPGGHYELDRKHTAVLASVMHEGVSHFIYAIHQF